MVMRIKSPKRQRWRKNMQRYLQVLSFFTLLLSGGVLLLEKAEDKIPEKISSSGVMIQVYDTEKQVLMTLDLEEYLVGVVAAEMPAGFAKEALQAQAVAARTFAVKRKYNPNSKVQALHPEAEITTSPELCQAWISEEEQRKRWGQGYEKYHAKITEAVEKTKGKVLTYQGDLAEALYHASCGGGNTEAAVNVWGNHVAYLVSIACNHPADKHSEEKTSFTWQEFSQRLRLDEETVATGVFSDFLAVLSRTTAERVAKIRVGNKILTGGQLRSLLGLKSNQFTYQVEDEGIIFTTNGYGHGVGMCQHGADYYAEQGYDYRQILAYYYPGTAVSNISELSF